MNGITIVILNVRNFLFQSLYPLYFLFLHKCLVKLLAQRLKIFLGVDFSVVEAELSLHTIDHRVESHITHARHMTLEFLLVFHFICQLIDGFLKSKVVHCCILFGQVVIVQDPVELPLNVIGQFG